MIYGDDEPRYAGECGGKAVYVIAAPGGTLEALADARDLESARALASVVRAVVGGKATAEELAAFVPLLADALDRVINVATRGVE
ncbi:hypothetical protein [Streptomyces chilikensis]|uniref:hypothetical protein n=1 Tax=Streptomyces chilikensis TaxID=1194079 RepID=UPI000A8610E8|nr:hypothetical protein [Streptomyces chilikensis]